MDAARRRLTLNIGMKMRDIISIVEDAGTLAPDTIVDLRDPQHTDLLAKYEYNWGFNPIEKGKPIGVIGAMGRVARTFTSEKGAKVCEGVRAAMARSTR